MDFELPKRVFVTFRDNSYILLEVYQKLNSEFKEYNNIIDINKKIFDEAVGRSVEFVQDNHSESQRGVLRGLHYQLDPFAQGKLVRCVVGEVFDVAVDIRKSSPTFGKWTGVILSAENKRQLWIPEGFAHGFVTLSERAQFVYKATNYYAPQI